jgi:microcystin-dependent protein
MFAPADALSNYFDASSGIGKNDCLGYALCDGQAGRPDLKGKFVVGYDAADSDYNAVAKTGGSKKHILSIAEMPAHRHTPTGGNYMRSGGPGNNFGSTGSTFSAETQTEETGGGQEHENRPPFYTVVYMIKL